MSDLLPFIRISCNRATEYTDRAYRSRVISRWMSQAKGKGLSAIHPFSQQLPQSICSGWQLEYQIIYLETQTLATHQMVDLQEEDVFEALDMLTPTGNDSFDAWRFRFPLAISGDLRQVLVLRTLVKVSFPVDPAGIACQSSGSATTQNLRRSVSSAKVSSERSYRVEFSPTDEAIAFVEAGPAGKLAAVILEIWSRDSATPSYIFRGHHRLGSMQSDPKSGPTNAFLFHPVHPMVVLAEWGRASLWWFEDQGMLQLLHVP